MTGTPFERAIAVASGRCDRELGACAGGRGRGHGTIAFENVNPKTAASIIAFLLRNVEARVGRIGFPVDGDAQCFLLPADIAARKDKPDNERRQKAPLYLEHLAPLPIQIWRPDVREGDRREYGDRLNTIEPIR